MNKSEYLTALASKVRRVINQPVELGSGDAKTALNAAGVKLYRVVALEQSGKHAVVEKAHDFYVFDEGEVSERAETAAGRGVQMPLDMLQDATTYLDAQGFIRYKSVEINADDGYAILRAFTPNEDGTATEQRILLYYDAQGAPAHRVLTA